MNTKNIRKELRHAEIDIQKIISDINKNHGVKVRIDISHELLHSVDYYNNLEHYTVNIEAIL